MCAIDTQQNLKRHRAVHRNKKFSSLFVKTNHNRSSVDTSFAVIPSTRDVVTLLIRGIDGSLREKTMSINIVLFDTILITETKRTKVKTSRLAYAAVL